MSVVLRTKCHLFFFVQESLHSGSFLFLTLRWCVLKCIINNILMYWYMYLYLGAVFFSFFPRTTVGRLVPLTLLFLFGRSVLLGVRFGSRDRFLFDSCTLTAFV